MGIVRKLIVCYIMQNKKRSIIAVGGVIFSTFVFVVISCSALWYYSYMKSIEININGSWQIRLHDLQNEQISKLKDLEGIKNIVINKGEESIYYVDIELDNVSKEIFNDGQDIGKTIGMRTLDELGEERYLPNGEKETYDISYHMDLLDFYGITYNDSQISIKVYAIGILIALAGVFSVFLYNIFFVSFIEKRKYIGLLGCVGASVKQRRLFIMGEGIVIGIVGIPLGLALGCMGTLLSLPQIKKYFEARIGITVENNSYIDIRVIFIAILLGFVVIIFSTFVPTIKAGRISPLDFLSMFRKQSISGKKIYEFKPCVKIEKNLARKNLLFNKRRSFTMIGLLMFALVIVLNAFVYIKIQNGDYLLQDRRKHTELDSWISIYSNDFMVEEALYNDMTNWNEIDNLSYKSELNLGVVLLSEECISSDLEDFKLFGMLGENPVEYINNEKVNQKKYGFYAKVVGVDSQSFDQYAKDSDIDTSEIENYEYPIIIEDYILVKKSSESEPSYRGVLAIEEGQSISMEYGTYADSVLLNNALYVSTNETIQFNVLGVTEKKSPFPQSPEEYTQQLDNYSQLEDSFLTIYMPYDSFRKFIKDDRIVKTYGKMPKNINQVIWRENNSIVNYLFFDTVPEISDKKLENKIAKSAYDVGLKKYDSSYRKNSINEISFWQYGNTKILKQQRYQNPGKIIKKLFIVATILLFVLFSITAWINYMLNSIILRRREFVMLRSIGMSSVRIKKMLMYEIFIQILISGVGGIFVGCFIMVMQFVEYKKTVAMEIDIPIEFIIMEYIIAVLLVYIIFLISTRRMKNINIIEILKNENE